MVADGGAYGLPVKANQPALRQAIADLFMPPVVSAAHNVIPLPSQLTQTISSGHGRLEYRYLTLPHVGQVIRLQRVVQSHKSGKLTDEVVFGTTSLTVQAYPPQRLMQLLRHHWHVKNRLHYVRDVTLHEDACKIRQPNRQRLLACLNNLVIGLIRQTVFAYVPEAVAFLPSIMTGLFIYSSSDFAKAPVE